jgi:thymidylate synthase (FAD)
MPVNENLPDIKLPVQIKNFEVPVTYFFEHLEIISVELLNAPSIEDLLEYIPRWGTATWQDKPHDEYSDEERLQILKDLFEGNLLPSAMETIGLVFLISNIDLVDVTHLLRHRTMSFSAVCTADRDLRHDSCLVKNSILNSKEFSKRYVQIVSMAKQLYADMVDSNEVSLLDARTILPRCLENHYYCRVNIKDALHFIRQRIDRQIQPESDNIIALQMWIEIVKKYPFIKNMIDVNRPDSFYVQTVPTGRSSNIYMPEKPRNDIFEYKPEWFLYKKERKEMSGGEKFVNLWNTLVEELNEIDS